MPRRRTARQAGFSLVEVLVAISLFLVIGTVLTGIVVSVLRGSTSTTNQVKDEASIIDAFTRSTKDIGVARPVISADVNNLVVQVTRKDGSCERHRYYLDPFAAKFKQDITLMGGICPGIGQPAPVGSTTSTRTILAAASTLNGPVFSYFDANGLPIATPVADTTTIVRVGFDLQAVSTVRATPVRISTSTTVANGLLPPSALAPAAPAAPTLTGTVSDATGLLSWNQPSGATGYVLQRDGQTIATIIAGTTTTYNDGPLSYTRQYNYQVYASGAGGQSAVSNTVLLTPTIVTTTLAGSLTGNTASLSWVTQPVATGYAVYRNGVLIGTTTPSVTTFTDAGIRYFVNAIYTVRIQGAGGEGFDSNSVILTPLLGTATIAGSLGGVNRTDANLSWNQITDATGYVIYRNGAQIATVAGGTTLTYTDAGRPFNTTDVYQVSGSTIDGVGAKSNTITLTTPPSAPTITASLSGSTSGNISWSQPPGATGYRLYRNSVLLSTITAGTTTTYTDSGLTANASYVYYIIATSSNGDSPASNNAVLGTAPSASTLTGALTSPVTNQSVTLSWTAPTGATSYVLARNGTTVYTGTALSFTDTGLTYGTSYSWTVQAVNSAGGSPLSNTVTILLAPDAPVLSGTATNLTLNTSWTAPASTTSYELYLNGSAVPVYAGTGMSFSQTVACGTSNTYTVAAKNATGLGPQSNAKLLIAAPCAPNLTGSITGGVVTLTWPAVTNAVSYTLVTDGVSGATVTSPFSPVQAAGSTHTYAVTAVNPAGSATSNTVSETLAPAAPTLTTACGTGGAVNITWTASSGATGYTLTRSGTTVYTGTGTSFTDSGLAGNTAYSYVVTATNSGGTTSSNTATITSSPAAPGSFLAVSNGATAVTTSWAASAGATSYTVTRNGTAIYTGTALTFTDTGLTTGTSYTYTVAASNGCGSGAASTATGTPTPGPTLTVVPSPTGYTVVTSWSAVSGATGYTLTRDGVTIYTGTALTFTDDFGAAPAATHGNAHVYTLVATTSGGGTSGTSTANALLIPDPPVTVKGQGSTRVDNKTVVILWTAPAGQTISSYSVRNTKSGTTTVLATGVNTTTYTDGSRTLAQESPFGPTPLTYEVASANATGTSAWAACDTTVGGSPCENDPLPYTGAVATNPAGFPDTEIDVAFGAPATATPDDSHRSTITTLTGIAGSYTYPTYQPSGTKAYTGLNPAACYVPTVTNAWFSGQSTVTGAARCTAPGTLTVTNNGVVGSGNVILGWNGNGFGGDSNYTNLVYALSKTGTFDHAVTPYPGGAGAPVSTGTLSSPYSLGVNPGSTALNVNTDEANATPGTPSSRASQVVTVNAEVPRAPTAVASATATALSVTPTANLGGMPAAINFVASYSTSSTGPWTAFPATCLAGAACTASPTVSGSYYVKAQGQNALGIGTSSVSYGPYTITVSGGGPTGIVGFTGFETGTQFVSTSPLDTYGNGSSGQAAFTPGSGPVAGTRTGGIGSYVGQVTKSGTGTPAMLSLGYRGGAAADQTATRFYARFTTLPTSDTVVASLSGPAASAGGARLWYRNSDQHLLLGFGTENSAIPAGATDLGTAFALNRWYRIDFSLDLRTTTYTAKTQIDGGVVGSATYTAAGIGSATNWYVGNSTGIAWTAQVDDVTTSAAVSDFPLGPTAGIGFTPASTLDASAAGAGSWTNQAGAVASNTDITAINEAAPWTGTGRYLQQGATCGTCYVRVGFANPTFPAGTSIVRGSYVVSLGKNATASNVPAFTLKPTVGGTQSSGTTTITGTGTVPATYGLYRNDLSTANLPGSFLDLGFSTVGSLPRVFSAGIEYELSALPAVAPAAPTMLTAAAGDTTATLSWSPVGGDTPVTGYQIVRDGVVVATSPAPATSYTNTGLVNNKTYTYTVRAVNTVGTSPDSPPALATPHANNTPDYLTGFEAGTFGDTNSNSNLLTSVLGNVTVVATPNQRPNSAGAYSLQVASTSGVPASAVIGTTAFGGTSAIKVARAYVYFATLPSGSAQGVIRWTPVGGGPAFALTAGTGGWGVTAGATTYTTQNSGGTATPAPVAGRWYLIDTRYTPGATPIVEVSINGAVQYSNPGASTQFAGATGTASTVSTFELGNTVAGQAISATYDDVDLTGASAAYPIGASGGIASMTVNGSSTVNTGATGTFTTTTSPNAPVALTTSAASAAQATRVVNDLTPIVGSTDYITQAIASATAYTEHTFTSPVVPAGRVVTAARLLAVGTGAGAAGPANSYTLKSVVGGAVSTLYTGPFGAGTTTLQGGTIPTPAGGWTTSALAGAKMQYGFATSVSPAGSLGAAVIEYELSPAPAATGPTGLTATAGNTQAVLSWAAAPGSPTSYNIYRAGVLVATIAAPATTYTNTGLTNGTAYTFSVTAVAGAETAPSNNAVVTPAAPAGSVPPNAPTGLAATPGNASVALTWTVPAGSPTSYQVLRGGTVIGTTTGTTFYTDTTPVNGTSYTYTVRAVNAAGSSGDSNAVTVTPRASGTSTATFPFETDPTTDALAWKYAPTSPGVVAWNAGAAITGLYGINSSTTGATAYNNQINLRTTWAQLGVPLGATVTSVTASAATKVTTWTTAVAPSIAGQVTLLNGGAPTVAGATVIGTLLPGRTVTAVDATPVTSTGTALAIPAANSDWGTPVWISVAVTSSGLNTRATSAFASNFDDLNLTIAWTQGPTTYQRMTYPVNFPFDSDPTLYTPPFAYSTTSTSAPTTNTSGFSPTFAAAGAGSLHTVLANSATASTNTMFAKTAAAPWTSYGLPSNAIIDAIDATQQFEVDSMGGNENLVGRVRIKDGGLTQTLAEPITGQSIPSGTATLRAFGPLPHVRYSVGGGARLATSSIVIEDVTNTNSVVSTQNSVYVDELNLTVEALIPCPAAGCPVPAAPTGLAGVGGAGQVALSWNPSATSNVTRYDIYRAGALIGSTTAPTTFLTDQPLGAGTYSYTVRAVGPDGTSVDSNTASASVTQPAPTGFTVTATSPTSAVGTWDAYPGATSYTVTRILAGSSLATFSAPHGVAVDSSGNVYIADYSNNNIRKITAAGVVTTLAGSSGSGYIDGTGTAASFNGPESVAVDSSGNVYVADYYNIRIRKITSAGVVTTFAGSGVSGSANGTGTAASFNGIQALTIDGSGNLYVADGGNGNIRKVTSAGVVTTLAGTGAIGSANGAGTAATFNLVDGVTVDGSGNVYVSEIGNQDIRKITSAGVVSTFAGSGTAGLVDGTGTAASFNRPAELTADSSGSVYVVDTGNNSIRKITSAGVVTTLAGSGATGFANGTGAAATFSSPVGIAIDGTGNLYVGDSPNQIIRKVTSAGVVTTFAGTGATGSADGLAAPTTVYTGTGTSFTDTGLTTGAAYVYSLTATAGTVSPPVTATLSLVGPTTPTGFTATTTSNSTIATAWTAVAGATSYTVTRSLSGSPATFSNPAGIVFDGSGNMYVADGANNKIRKITSVGVVTTFAGSGAASSVDGTGTAASFNQPYGVTIDASGNLYVAENLGNKIRKITSAGVVTTFAGSGAAGAIDGTGTAASFKTPEGVAVDASGNVWVADYGNNNIRKITSAGVVTTFAGSGRAGAVDGTGTSASFAGPSGVAVDASGNVWVADYGNNKIRKITSAGVVTTFAGSGTSGSLDGTGIAATFNFPNGVAVDASGTLYVAELSGNKIRKITSAGVVTTLAGSGTRSSVDGTGTAASFYGPFGVAVDSTGTVYDSDFYTGKIRKITSAGVVTTLAGSGGSGSADTGAPGPASTVYIGSGTAFGDTRLTIGTSYMYTLTVTTASGTSTPVTATATTTSVAPAAPTNFTVTATGSTSAFGSWNYDPNATTYTVYRRLQGFPAGLNIISGLGVGPDGVIYTSDYGIHRIRKITTNGTISVVAGNGSATWVDGTGTAASFWEPQGITFAPDGNIYLADSRNNRIRKITPLGVVTTLAGSGTAAETNGTGAAAAFNHPMGISSDTSGNLYVADNTASTIRKVVIATGVVTTLAGSGVAGSADGTGTAATFNNPNGCVVDTAGNVYVADSGNNKIRKITPAGVVTTFAGNGTASFVNGIGTTATFNSPTGITFDGTGNLYVTDRLNAVVRTIALATGAVTTLAGGGNPALTGFDQDGTGSAASIQNPTPITMDRSGNIIVGDANGAGSVRSITPGGVVTTIVGGIVNANTTGDGVGNAVVVYRGPLTEFTDTTAIPGASYTYTVIAQNSANIGTASNASANVTMPGPPATPTGLTATATGNTTMAVSWTSQADADSYTLTRQTAATPATFQTPDGITVDGSGNVFVADYGNNKIRKITSTGVVTTFAGSGVASSVDGTGTAATFNQPLGITVDSTGNVYVGDTYNHKIRKITSAGVVTTLAGSGTAGAVDGTGTAATFNYPDGVAVDGSGNVYVADTLNYKIRKITSAGVVTTLAGSGVAGAVDGTGTAATFNQPLGVAVDGSGNVYVGDASNNEIRKITSAGVVTTFAGSGVAGAVDGTGTAASFNTPVGVAVDSTGSVFVADGGNNKIRKITSAGVVTTLAGSGVAGAADGTGTAATFNGGRDVALNAAGNLFVADARNNKIRYVTSAGVVTTFAGSGAVGSTDTAAAGLLSTVYTGSATSYGDTGLAPGGIYTYTLTPTNVYGNGPAASANGTTTAVAPGTPTGFTVTPTSSTATTASWSAVPDAASYTLAHDIPGAVATFNAVNGVVVDSSGNIFVADQNNAVIRKITGNNVTTFVGSGVSGSADGTGTAASFNVITGLAIDATNNIYVCDTYNNKIRKVTPAGVVTTFVGSGVAGTADGTGTAATLNGPMKISIDSAANLYLTGSGSDASVRKVTSAGVVTTLAGSSTAGFTNGTGTAATFRIPSGTAVDSTGNVYVNDAGNYVIRKITPAGVVTTFAGAGTFGSADGTSTTAQFNSLGSLSIDASGNLFASDNKALRKITSTGVVTTVAGVVGAPATVDGTGTAARFAGLSAIAFDGAGNAIVADSNTVRKVTPAAVVTTIAGIATSPGSNNGLATSYHTIVYSGPALTAPDSGLTAGASYVYSVAASNAYGTGPGATANVTMAAPVAPTGFTVTSSGTGTAAASWTATPGTASYTVTRQIAATPATFKTPDGVAVDGSGNVFVADSGNNKIRKITSAGVVTTFAGSGAAGSADGTGTAATFYSPIGVAVDSTGNVFVGDYGNHKIRKITSAGVVTTFAGSGAAGSADGTGTAASFYSPIGVAVDSTGNVYVADWGNNKVRKITSAGVVTTLAGSGAIGSADGTGTAATFRQDYGVAVDSTSGNVYVADSGNQKIRQITSAGVVTTLAGSGVAGAADGTGTAATFTSPIGIAVDSVSGNVYVSDTGNNKIRKITSAGVVTSLAGSASGAAGAADGTGTAATFNGNYKIALDASKNLYVADGGNNKIRYVTSAGVVTTFAGSGVAGSTDSIAGTAPVTVYSGSATSFGDTGLASGTTYLYTLTATNGAGASSSVTASLTTP